MSYEILIVAMIVVTLIFAIVDFFRGVKNDIDDYDDFWN